MSYFSFCLYLYFGTSSCRYDKWLSYDIVENCFCAWGAILLRHIVASISALGAYRCIKPQQLIVSTLEDHEGVKSL